jgi:hypothetical protein
VPTTEERLESFMDKLSTWQLLGSLEKLVPDHSTLRTSNGPVKEDRDWMQVFLEEIVETQYVIDIPGRARANIDLSILHRFKPKLPELCALFRTKIFPNSPFSNDVSSSSLSRSSSPMLIDDNPDPNLKIPQKRVRSSSGASSDGRYPSPALPAAPGQSTSTSFSRVRSRSLSVSLAQDADTRRAGSVGAGVVTKKRALNREVSMSRVFKEKPMKMLGDITIKSTSKVTVDSKSNSQTGVGVTLVMATPVKGQKKAPPDLPTSTRLSRSPTPGGETIDTEEEDWSLASSPDVLLLGVRSGGKDEGQSRPFGIAGHILTEDTPVKKGCRGLHQPILGQTV